MEIDYLNLLGLTLIAAGAPLLMDALRLPVPDAAAMILLGIALGTAGLGWIEIDGAVEQLSALMSFAVSCGSPSASVRAAGVAVSAMSDRAAGTGARPAENLR